MDREETSYPPIKCAIRYSFCFTVPFANTIEGVHFYKHLIKCIRLPHKQQTPFIFFPNLTWPAPLVAAAKLGFVTVFNRTAFSDNDEAILLKATLLSSLDDAQIARWHEATAVWRKHREDSAAPPTPIRESAQFMADLDAQTQPLQRKRKARSNSPRALQSASRSPASSQESSKAPASAPPKGSNIVLRAAASKSASQPPLKKRYVS